MINIPHNEIDVQNIINELVTTEYPRLFSGLPEVDSQSEYELLNFCQTHKEVVLSTMPWIASEVAEGCGFKSLLFLIRQYGGRKIYFPKSASKFNEKYNVNIPARYYERLYKYSGGTGNLDIPSAWGVFVAMRRAALQVAMQEKMPQNFLVNIFGVTMRSIRSIKSKH